MNLILGASTFTTEALVIMAIVNRTPDSFYDKGAAYADDAAFDLATKAVAMGAEILDVGGVKAGPGENVDATEEIRRTEPFVARLRDQLPDVVISVDTWRADVADVLVQAGANLINDAWGGWDPHLVEVAAHREVGIVCTHTGGAEPRTRPHRVTYSDVTANAIEQTVALAERAAALGVRRESILIDPGHDFGKNTYHSLQLTRDLDQMVQTDWPVLVSLSNKDFVGETLDKPVDERLLGTLAATSISAWLGARVFRAHNIDETRQTLDMVSAIRGSTLPTVARRGLA